jgi:hypothetical protein
MKKKGPLVRPFLFLAVVKDLSFKETRRVAPAATSRPQAHPRKSLLPRQSLRMNVHDEGELQQGLAL